MNIPYKFRGIDADGFYHYGDLVQGHASIIVEEQTASEVLSCSVAQLIGYDIDGKEIYEGDVLIDKDGNIWDNLEIYSDVDSVKVVKEFKLRLKKIGGENIGI